MTINQTLLNDYFAGAWRRRDRGLEQFQYSGYQLVDKVSTTEQIIDIGCGLNPFKDLIPNLIGIDPAFPESHYQLSLEDFVIQFPESKFDVAFCLGSINFGTVEDIEVQLSILIKLLKPKSRIYWRCNPGLKDHGNQECNNIPFFPWSFMEHFRLSNLFNFRVDNIQWDCNNRIYAEWIRE